MTNSNRFALLTTFRELFEGRQYNHRDSSLGDFVASHLFEDLYTLGRSSLLSDRIRTRQRVVNAQNKTVGISRRRGDGTFGELVPVAVAATVSGFEVARGLVASIEIGAETKILAKAMIKQIDRVIGDLIRQTEEFKKHGEHPICIGIVGVNFSASYTSFEGARSFPTDGKTYKHPSQEAEEAVRRIVEKAKPHFDEFLLLKFSATNVPPFPFSWMNENDTTMQYAALLTRVSREYDRRFSS